MTDLTQGKNLKVETKVKAKTKISTRAKILIVVGTIVAIGIGGTIIYFSGLVGPEGGTVTENFRSESSNIPRILFLEQNTWWNWFGDTGFLTTGRCAMYDKNETYCKSGDDNCDTGCQDADCEEGKYTRFYNWNCYTLPPRKSKLPEGSNQCLDRMPDAARIVGTFNTKDSVPEGKHIASAETTVDMLNDTKQGSVFFCLSNNKGRTWKVVTAGDSMLHGKDIKLTKVNFDDNTGRDLIWSVLIANRSYTQGQLDDYLYWYSEVVSTADSENKALARLTGFGNISEFLASFFFDEAVAYHNTPPTIERFSVKYTNESKPLLGGDDSTNESNVNGVGSSNQNISTQDVSGNIIPSGNESSQYPANTNFGVTNQNEGDDVSNANTGGNINYTEPNQNTEPSEDEDADEDEDELDEPLVILSDTTYELDNNFYIEYHDYDKVIIKWYEDKGDRFVWGEGANFDQTADIYQGNDVGGDMSYVVLTGLNGGENDGYNEEGYENGRGMYNFNVESDDSAEASTTQFKTLNRKQAILYYYSLIFGDSFDIEQEYSDEEYSGFRDGGPAFFYNPGSELPMTLSGVKFTLLNDRKFEEFDSRLDATFGQEGINYAMKVLYNAVHDRIYPDDLLKIADDEGLDFWKEQVERSDNNRMDLSGVKFYISTSEEYISQEIAEASDPNIAQAEIAYQIVLKRGGDRAGVDSLVANFTDPKDMRRELVLSGEFTNRINEIEVSKGKFAAVEELYETILARGADVEGVQWKTDSGMPIEQIRDELLNSEEFASQ